MTDYEAVVYDLDGTLVQLNVDWDQARRDLAAKLRVRGIDVEDATLWTLFERGRERGLTPIVENTLEEHEREGARTSDKLPLARELPRDEGVGVCSLNSESACRIALETHGIDGIGAVVGRDTVATEKPDPEPLLETVRRLGGTPSEAVFIGDSDRDEVAANRAGIDYVDVSEWCRAYR